MFRSNYYTSAFYSLVSLFLFSNISQAMECHNSSTCNSCHNNSCTKHSHDKQPRPATHLINLLSLHHRHSFIIQLLTSHSLPNLRLSPSILLISSHLLPSQHPTIASLHSYQQFLHQLSPRGPTNPQYQYINHNLPILGHHSLHHQDSLVLKASSLQCRFSIQEVLLHLGLPLLTHHLQLLLLHRDPLQLVCQP